MPSDSIRAPSGSHDLLPTTPRRLGTLVDRRVACLAGVPRRTHRAVDLAAVSTYLLAGEVFLLVAPAPPEIADRAMALIGYSPHDVFEICVTDGSTDCQ